MSARQFWVRYLLTMVAIQIGVAAALFFFGR
jgi:hypothetical protein